MRRILGIVAGIVAALLAITIVELSGHQLYPTPPGADMSDPAVVTNYISTAPTGALVVVALGWFLGAMVGGWVALWITRWSPAGWIIAALIAAAGIYNATQIPAPLWMQLATVLAPALGGLAAHLLPGWRRA